MAGKNWQAGGKNLDSCAGRRVPARQPLVPLRGRAAVVAAASRRRAISARLDPNMIWEVLIGGIVVCVLSGAVALWVLSALRKVKRSQLRRNAFVSSALNNLNQGVVMTDAQQRDRLLQRPLSRNLRPGALGHSAAT